MGSVFAIAITSIYLLVSNGFRHLVYSVVLFLVLLGVIGSVFTILHLPGADELMLTGVIGVFGGAGLLIWRSFYNTQGQVVLYKFFAGALLIFQIVILLFFPHEQYRVGLLNYPVALFIGTLLIKGQYEHAGERNILIIFLLERFLYIFLQIAKAF